MCGSGAADTASESAPLLGVEAKGDDAEMTGLSADFATPECIDHVFISPGIRVLRAEREKAPRSPYAVVPKGSAGPASVEAASDHVYQLFHLEVA